MNKAAHPTAKPQAATHSAVHSSAAKPVAVTHSSAHPSAKPTAATHPAAHSTAKPSVATQPAAPPSCPEAWAIIESEGTFAKCLDECRQLPDSHLPKVCLAVTHALGLVLPGVPTWREAGFVLALRAFSPSSITHTTLQALLPVIVSGHCAAVGCFASTHGWPHSHPPPLAACSPSQTLMTLPSSAMPLLPCWP